MKPPLTGHYYGILTFNLYTFYLKFRIIVEYLDKSLHCEFYIIILYLQINVEQ